MKMRTMEQMNTLHFLKKDERVLWRGRPSLQRRFCRADIMLFPIFIPMLIFSFYMLYGSIAEIKDSPGIIIFVVGDALFCCVSMYGVFFRFLYKARKKKRTRYYITNKRVIVLQGKKIYDFPVSKAAKIAEVTEKNKKGIGTIYLDRKWSLFDMGDNTGLDFGGDTLYRWRFSVFMKPLAPTQAMAFFDIRNCERVLKLLRHIADNGGI